MKNKRLAYLYKRNIFDNSFMRNKEIDNIIKKCLQENKNQNEEVFLKNVGRYYKVIVKILEDKENYILTIRDITQAKSMIEIQKTFISDVSHELKTPLTNIKGYIIALEDENLPKELKIQFIKTIHNNTTKLENIIIDFLNISKYESSNIINIENIPIDKLKSELHSLLNESIKSNDAILNYNINILNNKGILKVDFEKLLTILKNLVENAIIYRSKDRPVIEISINEAENMYKIAVKDNGMGISTTEKEKIFERFYRIDKARTTNKSGSGLGLSIVKNIVKICGGDIDVISSKEKKGTTFIFTILK